MSTAGGCRGKGVAGRRRAAPGGRHGVFWLIVSAVAYGCLVILIKSAVAAGVNAETAMALRFTVASVFLWLTLGVRRTPAWPGARRAAQALGLGAVVHAGDSLAFYQATAGMSATLAAMAFAAVPVVVALLAWLLTGERLGRTSWIALALAVVGGAILAGQPTGGATASALLWLGTAVVLCALYFVLSAQLSQALAPEVVTTYVISGSAVAFWLWGGLTGRLQLHVQPAGWLAILGMALIPTLLGMSTYMIGVRSTGASRAAIISMLEPATGVMLAVLLLGDQPTLIQVAGGALVIVAAVLVQRERAREAAGLMARQLSGAA